MATNHGSIEFLKFPNPQYPGDTTKLIKKWLRDSWARRKIIALQQAIAAIVIPTKTSDLTNDSGFITSADIPPGSAASTTTPKMDGTAAVGTENAFARGDHRHPTDTSRQAALSAAQLAAVNSGVTAAKVAAWDGITVPTKTSELTNDSGYITSAPVASVNGKTGAVNLGAADVGALPDSTVIPSKTSQLTNDSGFLTAAPVTSVNGKTGAVNLTASDVGALPSSTTIPSKTSDLTNDSGYITASALPSVPSASTTNPKMDGTASAGSSAAWSRGDHVHPHDTSKADKATTLSGYGITNAYTKTEVDGLIPTIPTNVSAFTNDAGYVTASAVPDASSATPAMDGTGAAGASTDYARADHVHPSDSSKQDALSSAQMDAVNSGITAAKITEYDSIVTMFGTPEIIRSGDDLNDFMTPGHYSANSGTIASALVNCPTTINFSLFVFYRTITLLSQMIITSSTTIFVRHRNSSGWTAWYKFTGTTV